MIKKINDISLGGKQVLFPKFLCDLFYKNIKDCDAKSLIEKDLSILKKNGSFENRFIVIFGANWYSEFVMNYFLKSNIQVNAVIDNSNKKHGQYLGGIIISKPESVMLEYKENAFVIIATRFACEMSEQLCKMLYDKKQHIHVINGLFTDEAKKQRLRLFDMIISKLKMSKGYYVYEKLIRKYGDDATFLVIPVKGTGDVYIVCAHLENYLKEKRIDDCVLVFPTNSGKKIAGCFGFQRTKVISIHEIVLLRDFAGFVGYKNLNIKMMHWAQTKSDGIVSENFPFRSDMTMVDIYSKSVFDDIFIRSKMIQKLSEIEISKIFEKNGLIENRTVIISPYAQTFMGLPLKVWNSIIEQLKGKGYTVCTNIGAKDEQPLSGTIPLSVDYSAVIQVFEKAGYFIGIRSGLCDILSEAKCRKVIIYPKCINMESTKRFFSLVESGLDEDAIEIEFNNEDGFEEKVIGAFV